MSFSTRTATGALAATLAVGTSAGAAAPPPISPASAASLPAAANASAATATSAASLPRLHMGGLDQPQVAQRIILATF